MALSGKVKEYLDRQGLAYGLIARAAEGTLPQIAEVAGIMPRRLLRVVLLRDVEAVVMAILPSDRILDFSLLCQILGRDLEPLYGDEIVPFFTDCELGTRPPLPELFGMQALVDESLLDPNELYFDSGSCAALVRMTSKDFQVLMGNARWGRFSHGIEVLQLLHGQATLSEHISDAADRYTPKRLKKGIEAIKELPALPATAQHILALRDNPAGRVEALNQIVERDPSLAAQVIHWALSPFYSQPDPGRIYSVPYAIDHVLGFDTTMNLVLGAAMGSTFRIPLEGPLGLTALWRHSIYCAVLASELANVLPEDVSPRPEMAYLGGLLHNVGYLLLGYLFPAQFFLLNRFMMANAHLPLQLVERYVLGIEHPFIGAWLMQAWQMPEELTAAVRWHHQEDYSQPYAEYANLVLVANRLLHRLGIGDEDTDHLPTTILSSLGLDEEQALMALERVFQRRAELDALCRILPT